MNIPAAPTVRWVETPCHPAGRAVYCVAQDEYVLDWIAKPGHCTAMRVWAVDPYGNVTPCCGTAFADRLIVGNAFTEGLAGIVNRANVNPLLNTIAGWGGPYMLIKMLEEQGDLRYSRRRFASHCHACMTVLRDDEAMEHLQKGLSAHRLEALSARLASQALWYRSFVLGDKNANWLPEGWCRGLDRAFPGNTNPPDVEVHP